MTHKVYNRHWHTKPLKVFCWFYSQHKSLKNKWTHENKFIHTEGIPSEEKNSLLQFGRSFQCCGIPDGCHSDTMAVWGCKSHQTIDIDISMAFLCLYSCWSWWCTLLPLCCHSFCFFPSHSHLPKLQKHQNVLLWVRLIEAFCHQSLIVVYFSLCLSCPCYFTTEKKLWCYQTSSHIQEIL